MFDNCKEISSLWHDSSSFNRLVAKVMNPRCMCRVLKSCGVCGEPCPHFDTHIRTDYMMEAGLTGRALLGLMFYGSEKESPDSVARCAHKCNPHQANTFRHTHIHTRHLPRSHLHTITQQPLQSCTYSSALSKILLSYHSYAKQPHRFFGL